MQRLRLNEKGMGLIGVVAAAAMVVVVALAVANLVSDQRSRGVKLQTSSNCENIANSVIEYIKKDETSLFISSYGPRFGSKTFATGLDKNEDGFDRFSIEGKPFSLYTGKGPIEVPTTQDRLPEKWKYYNHLNIKNSANRLIALAANDDFCCANLNMNDTNCGDRFIDEKLTRANFHLSQNNVEVDLAIDLKSPNGASLCVGNRIPYKNIPDSKFNQPIDFKLRVKIKNSNEEKICFASSSVRQASDSVGPLTIMEMQNKDELCKGSLDKMPSLVGKTGDIVLKVKTVKNTESQNCQSFCLPQIENKNCDQLNSLNFFNTFTNETCSKHCGDAEPGSAFLCRAGEKNWFNDSANENRWEPCEEATVYDWDGKRAGKISIQYNPEFKNLKTETKTSATLTLSSLTMGRTYSIDVRAVDTGGNIGPSFCSVYPNSCSRDVNAQFRVVPPGVTGDCWPPPKVTSINNSACSSKTESVDSKGKKWPLTNGEFFEQEISGSGDCQEKCVVNMVCQNNMLKIAKDTCLPPK